LHHHLLVHPLSTLAPPISAGVGQQPPFSSRPVRAPPQTASPWPAASGCSISPYLMS
jgi:hypothetical protein